MLKQPYSLFGKFLHTNSHFQFIRFLHNIAPQPAAREVCEVAPFVKPDIFFNHRVLPLSRDRAQVGLLCDP